MYFVAERQVSQAVVLVPKLVSYVNSAREVAEPVMESRKRTRHTFAVTDVDNLRQEETRGSADCSGGWDLPFTAVLRQICSVATGSGPLAC